MNEKSHQTLLPYQPRWPEQFESEKAELLKVFGDRALAIEHIGSTAVPGLTAKDIIDIGVLIAHHEDADGFTELLKELYYVEQVPPSTERHFYRKGEPITYHLSIVYKSRGGFWDRQILFRDYLRAHSDTRDAYARLKENLLKEDPTGKDTYIAGKGDFVMDVLQKAGWKNHSLAQ